MKKLITIISVIALLFFVSGCKGDPKTDPGTDGEMGMTDKTGENENTPKKGKTTCTFKDDMREQVIVIDSTGDTMETLTMTMLMFVGDASITPIIAATLKDFFAEATGIKGYTNTVSLSSDKKSVIVETTVDLVNLDVDALQKFYDVNPSDDNDSFKPAINNRSLKAYIAFLEGMQYSCK